jgi:hypothetical protein
MIRTNTLYTKQHFFFSLCCTCTCFSGFCCPVVAQINTQPLKPFIYKALHFHLTICIENMRAKYICFIFCSHNSYLFEGFVKVFAATLAAAPAVTATPGLTAAPAIAPPTSQTPITNQFHQGRLAAASPCCLDQNAPE